MKLNLLLLWPQDGFRNNKKEKGQKQIVMDENEKGDRRK